MCIKKKEPIQLHHSYTFKNNNMPTLCFGAQIRYDNNIIVLPLRLKNTSAVPLGNFIKSLYII